MADAQPFIPVYIKEPRVFYDRKRGMMLLGKWGDGRLWLFKHNPLEDCWTSVREATNEDIQTVEAAMKSN